MKTILILFSVLILYGLSVSANAQSTESGTAHVVINEIEINPPGDDTKLIGEWIELYNPTDSKIDISGWKIASTSAMKKTLIIPTGTFIAPGKFTTFFYQNFWFTDTNDSIELKDKNGLVVDKTPLFNDMKNDFNSWQRIQDGHDLNSASDWKFAITTAGTSNGKLISAEQKDTVRISISANKFSYLFDEIATIQGNVSKSVFVMSPSFHADKIIVKISSSNYEKIIYLYPDLNLNYKTSLNLQKVIGIKEGSYTVSATYGDATSETSFSVGDKIPVDNMQKVQALGLSTDKVNYLPGDTVNITGSISVIIPLESVKFSVVNPGGKVISSGNLYPVNGKFSTTLFLNTVNPVYGKYQIIGDYANDSILASFEIIKDIKELTPISLSTDKQAYALGDTVTISGRLNKQWVKSMDLEIIQTKNNAIGADSTGSRINLIPGSDSGFKILDMVKISGNGAFTYSFKIPDNQLRLGDYKISVSQHLGSASLIIHAVANTTSYVSSTESLSLSTEKAIYDLNESLTIDGFIANLSTYPEFLTAFVNVSITDKNGKLLEITSSAKSGSKGNTSVGYDFTSKPDSSGRFSIQTKIDQKIFTEGTYKIKAKYSGLTKTISIEVVDPLKSSANSSLTLNKTVFGLNENVVLTGLVPRSGDNSVNVSLTKPDGSRFDSGALIENQHFSWSWTTPLSEKPLSEKSDDRHTLKTNYGVYKIHVFSTSNVKDFFFKVSADPIHDSLSLAPLYVSTEKSLYKAGEKLKVIGNIFEKEKGSDSSVGNMPTRITIQVLDTKAPFKKIHEAFVYPNGVGYFQSLFELPLTIFTQGDYKVTASYSGKHSTSIFTVANELSLDSSKKLSLLLDTDKSEYYPGDTVTVSGKPSKIIYLEQFDITVIKKLDGQITCGSYYCGKNLGPVTTILPSYSGSFSHQIKLSDASSSLGSYEISVNAGFETKSLVFNVVEKPIVVESEKSPLTVIEKFNRILDNKILIITETKSLDGKNVSPRVISGSLLTTKLDQSSVNLRVTSESGICVIGPEQNCLVKNSTKQPSQIYQIVSVDGINLKVKYTGSDVYLEKFDILPESTSDFLPNTNWRVDVIKDDQASRFYYTINYKILE